MTSGILCHICGLIGHRRSKRRARPLGDSWRSECRLCGTQLRRVAPREWVPIVEARREPAGRPTTH